LHIYLRDERQLAHRQILTAPPIQQLAGIHLRPIVPRAPFFETRPVWFFQNRKKKKHKLWFTGSAIKK
jgi:hypothetical protein